MLGHQQARLAVGGAAAGHSELFGAPAERAAITLQQLRVGRVDVRDDFDAEAGQQRLELLPQRFGAPVHRSIVHVGSLVGAQRLGASMVPRHFFAPQRHSYCFFSFFV